MRTVQNRAGRILASIEGYLHLQKRGRQMAILEDISVAVQAGKKNDVIALVNQAVEEGIGAEEILGRGLIDPMSIVGEKFSKNEVFVPEMLIAARAMSAGTEILKPLLVEQGSKPLGKAVIGTVKGDMHDIGKNLVRMMIEGKGIEITDLGVDVSSEAFIDHLKANPDCRLLCLSSLLTTTLPMIPEIITAVIEAGLRDQVKILVGGAPVTQEFADQIGADAYGRDALEAVDIAKIILK